MLASKCCSNYDRTLNTSKSITIHSTNLKFEEYVNEELGRCVSKHLIFQIEIWHVFQLLGCVAHWDLERLEALGVLSLHITKKTLRTASSARRSKSQCATHPWCC